MIARSGFGLKVNSLDDPQNPFVKHANNIVAIPDGANLLFTLVRKFLPAEHMLPPQTK